MNQSKIGKIPYITEQAFIELAELASNMHSMITGNLNFQLAEQYVSQNTIELDMKQVSEIYKALPDAWEWRDSGGFPEYHVQLMDTNFSALISDECTPPKTIDSKEIVFRVNWRDKDPQWRPVTNIIINSK